MNDAPQYQVDPTTGQLVPMQTQAAQSSRLNPLIFGMLGRMGGNSPGVMSAMQRAFAGHPLFGSMFQGRGMPGQGQGRMVEAYDDIGGQQIPRYVVGADGNLQRAMMQAPAGLLDDPTPTRRTSFSMFRQGR